MPFLIVFQLCLMWEESAVGLRRFHSGETHENGHGADRSRNLIRGILVSDPLITGLWRARGQTPRSEMRRLGYKQP